MGNAKPDSFVGIEKKRLERERETWYGPKLGTSDECCAAWRWKKAGACGLVPQRRWIWVKKVPLTIRFMRIP